MFVGMGANSPSGYNITDSLLLRSSASPYLERTPTTAGNRRTWTWSGWYKRGQSSQDVLFTGGEANGTYPYNMIRVSNADQLLLGTYGLASVYTNALLRDYSAWYHLVVVFDTTQATATDRVKMYINGVQQTTVNTPPYAQNYEGQINNTKVHYIGAVAGASPTSDIECYLTEVNFVDGQALTPSDFGEYNTDGVWSPKKYTGTYGTNGFYLPFNSEVVPSVSAGFGGTASNALYDDTAYLISNTSTGSAFQLMEYDFGESINMIDYNIQDLRFTGGTSTFKIYTSDVGGSLSNYTERASLSVSSSYQNYSGNLGVTARYIQIRAVAFGTNGQGQINYFNVDVDANNFSDNSGNANNWTPNNINLVADITSDVPTPADEDTGNFATLNPLVIGDGGTMSDGNLTFTTPTATRGFHAGTIGMTSGKWYWEVTCSASTFNSTNRAAIGYKLGNERSSYVISGTDGDVGNMGFYTGDTVGFAFDADNGTLENFINGVSNATVASIDMTKTWFPIGADAHTAQNGTVHWNFGQRPFKYTPPTGFKKINTYNLPDSSITDGSDYFNTVTYTGTGGTNNITGVGFSPDFFWLKDRTLANSHNLFDTVRGIGASNTKRLSSNQTTAESTYSTITSVNSDGFVLGDGLGNQSGNSNVAWLWRASDSTAVSNTDGTITSTVSANPTSGFSVVTYTGNGSANQTVGHGLGQTPKIIIYKDRSAATAWRVIPAFINDGYYLALNDTSAMVTASTSYFGSNTSTTLGISGSNSGIINASGNNLVAYAFADVEGFSKFGSYTGNGSTDGPFVYTGFRPAFVMIKLTSASGGNWHILDTSRDTYNLMINNLYPNSSIAESTSDHFRCDTVSNGFKLRTSSTQSNYSGQTFIYMAFAENPFKNSLAR